MDRRRFGGALIGALANAAAVDAAGQAPRDRLYKVGILTLGSDPAASGFWQRFLDAMRELEYVEGANLSVKREFADGNAARLPLLASELVRPTWTSSL